MYADTPDGWRIRVVYASEDGAAVVRELHITPRTRKKTPPGGLTARRLRLVRILQALPLAQRFADQVVRFPSERAQVEGLIEGRLPPPSGRQRVPDELLALLSIRYAEILESGNNSPIAGLAKEFHYSKHRARDLVALARRYGFLEGAARGRAGGRATDKAFEVTSLFDPEKEPA